MPGLKGAAVAFAVLAGDHVARARKPPSSYIDYPRKFARCILEQADGFEFVPSWPNLTSPPTGDIKLQQDDPESPVVMTGSLS